VVSSALHTAAARSSTGAGVRTASNPRAWYQCATVRPPFHPLVELLCLVAVPCSWWHPTSAIGHAHDARTRFSFSTPPLRLWPLCRAIVRAELHHHHSQRASVVFDDDQLVDQCSADPAHADPACPRCTLPTGRPAWRDAILEDAAAAARSS
jgi:hypothetical protein